MSAGSNVVLCAKVSVRRVPMVLLAVFGAVLHSGTARARPEIKAVALENEAVCALHHGHVRGGSVLGGRFASSYSAFVSS